VAKVKSRTYISMGSVPLQPKMRKNQTQLILPGGQGDSGDLRRVIVDWLVPALVEKLLRSQVEIEVSGDDPTSEPISREEAAVQAETQC
jgi:hypothetical protein